jgi:YfiH family protein
VEAIVSEAFPCHTIGALRYHTAAIFESRVRHAFSTRQGGVSAPPFDSLNLGKAGEDPRENILHNYQTLCDALGVDIHTLVFSKQVHGDVVRPVSALNAEEGLWKPVPMVCDALVTDDPGVCLVVFMADCVPILFYDPKRQAVGAAHAGWRGTGSGIVKKTVEAMRSSFGTNPSDIRAAIGPSIGPCCFETHPDVPQALTDALGDAVTPYIQKQDEEHFHIDLKKINALWLREAGVPETQIARFDVCTSCQAEAYYSHRRDGARRGSMASFIALPA